MTSVEKPRIALMGEFSAGKSTLSNLLIGARPLPERVTATRLSPVWIASGAPAAHREHLDGSKSPVSVEAIGDVPIEDTRVIRLFMESDMLDSCDLIDCPGISDPNMPTEVWERLVPEIDAVIWCTHATQAWRQSEAAVWETLPSALRKRSLLLVTRFDKLTNEVDRKRVMTRVAKEAGDEFAGIFPISLTGALAAGDDAEKWEASGAHDFALHLMALIEDLQGRPDTNAAANSAEAKTNPPAKPAEDAPRVAPRRIRPVSSGERSKRPASRPLRPVPSAESQP
ncbi:MAG: dynamin family protein [Pseudomonadota bacterium]